MKPLVRAMNKRAMQECACILNERDKSLVLSIIDKSKTYVEFLESLEKALDNEQFINLDSYHIVSFMVLMAGRRSSLMKLLNKLIPRYPSLKIELLSMASYVQEKDLKYEMWIDQIELLIRRLKDNPVSLMVARVLKIVGSILIWHKFDKIEQEHDIFGVIDDLMNKCECFSIFKSILYSFYAFAYHQLGSTDISLEMLTQAEKLLRDCIIETSQVMNMKGIILGEIGRAEESINACQVAYKARYELGNIVGAAAALNNMAMQYWSIGDTEKASAQIMKAIEMFREYNFPTVVPMLNLALIYIGDGDYEKALTIALQAKSQAKAFGMSYIGLPMVLSQAYIYLKRFDEAEKYIAEYKNMMEKSSSKRDTFAYHFLVGLLEKTRLNLYNSTNEFLKAIEIAEDFNMISEIIETKIKFAETMLHKYLIVKDMSFIQIAEAHIEDARLICEEQELDRQLYYTVKLSVYIETILGNKKKAKDIVNEAIAKFDSNPPLQKKLVKLREEVKKSGSKRDVESLIRSFTDSAQKLLRIHIFKRPKKISFKLLGYIIMMKQSGLAIISKIYDQKISTDSNLVAGLISAVSTFLQQISNNKNEGNLKSILHENISILIETDEQFSYLLLVDHETYEARKLLRKISQTFRKNYPANTDWDGNLGVFKNAEKVITPIVQSFIEQ